MKIDDTNLLEALKHTPPDPLAAKGRSGEAADVVKDGKPVAAVRMGEGAENGR